VRQPNTTHPKHAGPRKRRRHETTTTPVACELARASSAPAQHHPPKTPQARASADATQQQLSTPLLNKLQLAAIDQMRQAIADHIGIEAFGL
jgi:hypothetical protein